jgi:hypothetical protein
VGCSESLGFWTSSIARNSKSLENITFQKLNLFSSSGERRDTPTQLGPLERANFRHWSSDIECYRNQAVVFESTENNIVFP